jgi:hypothetical protein
MATWSAVQSVPFVPEFVASANLFSLLRRDYQDVDAPQTSPPYRPEHALDILLLATDIACKRNAFQAIHLLEVFEHVTIHPAIYKLVNAERWHTLRTMFPSRVKSCEEDLLKGIKQRLLTTGPRDEETATDEMAESFLKQALFGCPMTRKNDTLVAEALNELSPDAALTARFPGWIVFRDASRSCL